MFPVASFLSLRNRKDEHRKVLALSQKKRKKHPPPHSYVHSVGWDFSNFLLLPSTGGRTQGLRHARQVLFCCLSQSVLMFWGVVFIVLFSCFLLVSWDRVALVGLEFRYLPAYVSGVNSVDHQAWLSPGNLSMNLWCFPKEFLLLLLFFFFLGRVFTMELWLSWNSTLDWAQSLRSDYHYLPHAFCKKFQNLYYKAPSGTIMSPL